MKSQLVLALALVSIGVIGLIAVGCQTQSVTPLSNPQGFGFPGGMMGPGMMSGGMMNAMMGNGMMGMHGASVAPNVNATPVPANQPIDREVKILARNSQFDPARIVVKQGETVRFAFTNQDPYLHNFGSIDARIPFILLPANGTASTAWVAAQKGAFSALCTFHPGMQMQIVVE